MTDTTLLLDALPPSLPIGTPAPAHMFLEAPLADGHTTVESHTAPGLTWRAPLESRPIVLGPGADHPDLRPALAIDAAAWVAGRRHGLEVGRARIDLDEGALWYAHAPDMATAHERLAFLVEAAARWDHAIAEYVTELS